MSHRNEEFWFELQGCTLDDVERIFDWDKYGATRIYQGKHSIINYTVYTADYGVSVKVEVDVRSGDDTDTAKALFNEYLDKYIAEKERAVDG